jgi:tetratricopeptide (TPR) repeat protein
MAELQPDELRYLGIEAFKAGDYEQAIEKFNALVLISDHPFDNRWRILTLQLLGRYSEACAALQMLLDRNSTDTFALHQLGHIKSCCGDPSLRDGPMAVKLSIRLCELSEWKNWEHISVLAAAHAEVGDWDSAQQFASMALELAPDNEKARREARLNQYKQHRPFHSSVELDRSLIIERRQGE